LMIWSGKTFTKYGSIIRRRGEPKMFWFLMTFWLIGPAALWIVGLKWLLIG
jgi:hypothetical protein